MQVRENFFQDTDEPPMKSFLSTEQVAELTGKHPDTIRRWCREKRIKSKKIGREFLIPSSEFTIKRTVEEKNRQIIDYVFR